MRKKERVRTTEKERIKREGKKEKKRVCLQRTTTLSNC